MHINFKLVNLISEKTFYHTVVKPVAVIPASWFVVYILIVVSN